MSNSQLLDTSRDSDYVSALAELTVSFGANLQPGQILAISSEPGKEELARAIAEAAYRRGALYVDLNVFDMHFKRARALYANPETLKYVPPWLGERALALGEHRCARVALTGPVGAAADGRGRPDADRARHASGAARGDAGRRRADDQLDRGAVPDSGLGGARLPGAGASRTRSRGYGARWRYICRLDEADPVQAWERRLAKLSAMSERLDELHLDALRFEGPGTDLTIGLLRKRRVVGGPLPDDRRDRPRAEHPDRGGVHDAGPAARRRRRLGDQAAGHLRAPRSPACRSSSASGRAVRFEAEQGAEVLRGLSEHDDGAARLGEVALVDREGRIGPLETVFYDTLIDENAASHIAIGQALRDGRQGPRRAGARQPAAGSTSTS